MSNPNDPFGDINFAGKPRGVAPPPDPFAETTFGMPQHYESSLAANKIESGQSVPSAGEGTPAIVPPKPEPYADYMGRIKSAGTGLANTAINTAYRIPDTVQLAKDIGSFGYNKIFGEEKPQQAAPTVAPGDVNPLPPTATQETASKVRQRRAQAQEWAEENPDIMGMAAGFGFMPVGGPETSAEAKQAISPYLYTPKTESEKNISRDIEAGGTWAALSPKSAFGTPFRAVTGAGLEQISRGAETALPGAAPFIPLVGQIIGETGAGTFATLNDSESRYVSALKNAYNEDVRTGNIDPSKITPDMKITDIPFNRPNASALRKLAKQQSQVATDTSDFSEFNRTAKGAMDHGELRGRLVGDISGDIEKITGVPNDRALEAQDAINKDFSDRKTAAYDDAKSSVPGQAVPRDVFGGYAETPIVNAAEKQIQDAIASNPSNPRYKDIVVPTDTKPGNYAYYEQVYRQLRDSAFLKNANLPTDEINISNARDAAQGIKNALDKHMTVDGQSLSANARGIAQDHFNADNIIGVGENFLNEEPANASEAQASERAFNSLSPDERGAATYGALNQFNKIISDDNKGGLNWAAKKFDTDATFNRKMQMLLGKRAPDGSIDLSDYDALRGKVLAAQTRANIPPWDVDIKNAPPSFSQRHPNMVTALAAGAGSGLPVAANYLQDFLINSNLMTAAGLAGVGALAGMGTAAKLVNDSAVKRAANDIVLKMSTGNVRDLAELSRLMRTNPLYGAVYRGINVGLSNEQNIGADEKVRRGWKKGGRAFFKGGRVGRASGGRTGKNPKVSAEKLIALADRVKNEQTKNTEPLLNLDDTTVAKALAVANKHI